MGGGISRDALPAALAAEVDRRWDGIPRDNQKQLAGAFERARGEAGAPLDEAKEAELVGMLQSASVVADKHLTAHGRWERYKQVSELLNTATVYDGVVQALRHKHGGAGDLLRELRALAAPLEGGVAGAARGARVLRQCEASVSTPVAAAAAATAEPAEEDGGGAGVGAGAGRSATSSSNDDAALSSLSAHAAIALPVLHAMVQDVVARPAHKGASALLPALKPRERAAEKVQLEHEGDTRRLLDLARCSIVCPDLQGLVSVLKALLAYEAPQAGAGAGAGAAARVRVVGVKDTLSADAQGKPNDKGPMTPQELLAQEQQWAKDKGTSKDLQSHADALQSLVLPPGKYRDVKVRVCVVVPPPTPGATAVEHICEVQLHLGELVGVLGPEQSFAHYHLARRLRVDATVTDPLQVLGLVDAGGGGDRSGGAAPPSLTAGLQLPGGGGGGGDDGGDGGGAAAGGGPEAQHALDDVISFARDAITAQEKRHAAAAQELAAAGETADAGSDAQLEDAQTMARKQLSAVDTLGRLLTLAGGASRLAEAEPLLRRAYEGKVQLLGAVHPSTLISAGNLASLLQTLASPAVGEGAAATTGAVAEQRAALGEEALSLLKQLYEVKKTQLGTEHPATLVISNNLAVLLQDQGKFFEAEPWFRHTLEGKERGLGKWHPSTLVTADNLAFCLKDQGKMAEAEPVYRFTIKARATTLGQDHPETLLTRAKLAIVLANQGALHYSGVHGAKLGEAEELLCRALAGLELAPHFGAEHTDTVWVRQGLADVRRLREIKAQKDERAEAGGGAGGGADSPAAAASQAAQRRSKAIVPTELGYDGYYTSWRSLGTPAPQDWRAGVRRRHKRALRAKPKVKQAKKVEGYHRE